MSNYMTGFGNHFATEAVPGALPLGRNSPQQPPFGLYAEQLSGTAFTAPRHENRRSWLYRLRPTAAHPPFTRYEGASAVRARHRQGAARAQPPALGSARHRGRRRLARRPDDDARRRRSRPIATGVAVHVYRATKRHGSTAPSSAADGELLVIPQQGRAHPAHRAGPDRRRTRPDRADPARRALPRRRCPTARRAAMSPRITARPFRLPDLGPIGANGLANPRDFETPVAWFEDRRRRFRAGPEIPAARCGRPTSTTRRSMSSPGTAISRRAATICARFNTIGTRQLRPSRSVDLHRADLAQRRARHRQCRFRDLPAALDGRRGHVPPALVPPQRHERVHGPDHRRL